MTRNVLLPLALLLALLGFSRPLLGQEFNPYHQDTDFHLGSPGSFKYGLYGFENPALLNTLDGLDLSLVWSDGGGDWNSFSRWGFFAAVPSLGFGMINRKIPGAESVNDYRISTAFGSKGGGLGIGYGWSSDTLRPDLLTLGYLMRPNRYLSLGLGGIITFGGEREQWSADLGIRPLGNEVLTLFGDFAMLDNQNLSQGTWSAGAVVEPLSGVRLSSRYFSSEHLAVGVQFSLGALGLTSQQFFDADFNDVERHYGVRLGTYDRTFLRSVGDGYLVMNMKGPIKHQQFAFFDNSQTLLSILDRIDAAAADPAIRGIALNTSGMLANRETLWEIRSKLLEFKMQGKRVIVFVDRTGMDGYHFASVADRVVLDPMGTIMLEGYVSGRTYLEGMLEKLGIGFEEWRLFKYKSAMETFAREKMSEGEEEQRMAMIQDFYQTARSEICAARGMDADEFDRIVDDMPLLHAQDAVDKNLVDTLGRWDDVMEIVHNLETFDYREMGSLKLTGTSSLARYQLPEDDRWGEKPKVAVIYALGVCAMDEGINARQLVGTIQGAASSSQIEAIVFRVESPGGDALASDLVAEALRDASQKKPVIVSQGAVAASGGYWVSMYGDQIVAAPNTITGSIGVIGGWFYDDGLKEEIGVTTDFVKIGEHADLGFGFQLPLIGVGLPDRNLTPEERAMADRSLMNIYRKFIDKVADGRNMDTADVAEIAQGRVWTGLAAERNGLVDKLGNLYDAIMIARRQAGVDPTAEIELVEMPEPGLFDPGAFAPSLIGIDAPLPEDPRIEYLRFRIEHNGLPLPILPMEEMEVEQVKARK